MRLVGSFAFLLGALSVGAYAYFPKMMENADAVSVRPAATASPTASATLVAAAESSTPGLRTFSPGLSVFQRMAQVITGGKATDESANSPAKTPEVTSSDAWRPNVTAAEPDAKQRGETSAAKSDEYMARYELSKSLQAELKRVGCFAGDIDGDWGPVSKRAVSAFLSKVNATLPIDNPDYILLTLIQGHADRACGIDCPSGQALSADGRCVPTMIVAQAPARAASRLARKTLDVKPKLAVEELVAHASPAVTPPAAPHQAAQRGAVSQPWQTKVTATAAEPVAKVAALAKADPPKAAAAPAPKPIVIAAPLPVRAPESPRSAEKTLAAKPVVKAPVEPVIAAVESTAHASTVPTSATQPSQQVADIQPVVPLPGRMSIGAPVASEPAPAAAPNLTKLDTTEPALGQSATEAAPTRRAATPSPRYTRRSKPRYRDYVAIERPRSIDRPRAMRPPRYARNSGMVRTFQGKVRRGSPQHNLMLSLGGVF